ncbi:cell division cycle 20.3, cofactor of APC complex-like [Mangifera indica]|uniref:cell division cycle 20.3, cofactor of APC complex-like n=1 Tax=Mangifera indica TaxID=29780 RepID=UPI001CFBA8D2|nr:cell division cycle 20.3, cofactor of APC complex-like [Mangifera indica]
MDHQRRLNRLLETDWYSPRRLLSSPTEFDFPGDRFIPSRSLMNLDQAYGLLTDKTIKRRQNPNFNDAYRQKLVDNLTLDSEGRPFRMLVFRGSPKSSRKTNRLIDEMRREDAEALRNSTHLNQHRGMPKKEAKILDAPNLRNDFYLNIMDWGKNNVLAIALGQVLYLWKSENGDVRRLSESHDEDNYPTSVIWSQDARNLAVGYMNSELQIWDAETSKLVRKLEGHHRRVTTVSWNQWNGHILTSAGLDKSIINHDVRVSNNVTSCIKAHSEEVVRVKWSTEGNVLASGGNDNLVYIWEPTKMSSSKFLCRFNEHTAAVKALAWCPYQFNVLASGGGSEDGRIKIWNVQKGTCISSVDSKAQICGLEWNKHHKEILSGHGFSSRRNENRLCLWKYPSMTKVGELKPETPRVNSRVLELSQSPDGLTVVSAGADETLRFWEIFGPPSKDSNASYLDSLLSLKTSPIR